MRRFVITVKGMTQEAALEALEVVRQTIAEHRGSCFVQTNVFEATCASSGLYNEPDLPDSPRVQADKQKLATSPLAAPEPDPVALEPESVEVVVPVMADGQAAVEEISTEPVVAAKPRRRTVFEEL